MRCLLQLPGNGFSLFLACVHRRAGATPVLPVTDPRGLGRLWVCKRCWGDWMGVTAAPPAQENEDRDLMTALLLAPRGTGGSLLDYLRHFLATAMLRDLRGVVRCLCSQMTGNGANWQEWLVMATR